MFKNFASSANKYISVLCLQKSGKSFKNIINHNGPKMLPCGIPLNTKQIIRQNS